MCVCVAAVRVWLVCVVCVVSGGELCVFVFLCGWCVFCFSVTF